MIDYEELVVDSDSRLRGPNQLYSALRVGRYIYVSRGSYFFSDIKNIPNGFVVVRVPHSLWAETFRDITEEGIIAGLIRGDMEVVKR